MGGQRGFFRVSVEKNIYVTEIRYLTKEEKKTGYFGEEFNLIDISATGMKIEGHIKYSELDKIYIYIELEGNIQKIEGEIIGARKLSEKDLYEYRVLLNYRDRSIEHAIFSFVNRLQGHALKQKSLEAYDRGESQSIDSKIRNKERRKGIGIVTILPIMGFVVSGGLLISIVLTIFMARPVATDPLSLYFDVPYSLEWNRNVLGNAYKLSGVFLIVSWVSYFLDYGYKRRRTDKKNKGLIAMAVLAIILIAVQSTFIFTNPVWGK